MNSERTMAGGRRAFRCALISMAFASLAAQSRAGVIYVKASAAGANDGSSWMNAFTDLQAGLTAAVSGDAIWVAAGTYKPTGPPIMITFMMKQNVGIYGGFAGTETARERRDWVVNPTILSGHIGAAGVASDNTDSVVEGADSAIIDGFVIRDGANSGIVNLGSAPAVTNCTLISNGIGMSNLNFASPVVAHCTFSSNAGSGMFNLNESSPKVSDCTFSRNAGRGMSNSYSSSPEINRCTFAENSEGGMDNTYSSSPHLNDCLFMGNSAWYGSGGGMQTNSGAPVVSNCVFAGNSAAFGGGMRNINTDLIAVNCTFSGNKAEFGSGISAAAFPYTILINCILWDEPSADGLEVADGWATYRNCNVRSCGWSGANWNAALGTDGLGNREVNPRFVDASNPIGPDGIWRTADDGLELTRRSLCIDAGRFEGSSSTDILGSNRFGVPDIGAYETYFLNAASDWALYR